MKNSFAVLDIFEDDWLNSGDHKHFGDCLLTSIEMMLITHPSISSLLFIDVWILIQWRFSPRSESTRVVYLSFYHARLKTHTQSLDKIGSSRVLSVLSRLAFFHYANLDKDAEESLNSILLLSREHGRTFRLLGPRWNGDFSPIDWYFQFSRSRF